MARYFKASEFACNCGCGGMVQPELVEEVDELRHQLGKPIIINSGFRCLDWNRHVGGAPSSYHMQGLACDLKFELDPLRNRKLVTLALNRFRGIGIYKNFVHVDLRKNPAFWVA